MNQWINKSIAIANETDYLDKLFKVYPTIQEGKRVVDSETWYNIEKYFKQKNNSKLFFYLSELDLFPIKDSYVAYLKRDKSAISRNPQTVDRICERVYQLTLRELKEKIEEPKETNRQIGPMFKNWVKKNNKFKVLGLKDFKNNNNNNAILDATDAEMMNFAKENFKYTTDKGIDFIAYIHKKFVIGETKFLTDMGGHQNAQFNDAVTLLKSKTVNCIKIAILDGVLYIKRAKLYNSLINELKEYNIFSALLLNEFLENLKNEK